jgi:hypothetical protein
MLAGRDDLPDDILQRRSIDDLAGDRVGDRSA